MKLPNNATCFSDYKNWRKDEKRMVSPHVVSLFCQINFEFWCHEKTCFLKKIFIVGKYAENERFWKWLGINQFRFLYKLWACQSYAMRWSKLWYELVTAMLWGRQMPQVSVSFATSERLRCHLWLFRMWKKRKMERKNGFSTPFSFLDWTEKSTKICQHFSQNRYNHKTENFTFDSCSWKSANSCSGKRPCGPSGKLFWVWWLYF